MTALQDRYLTIPEAHEYLKTLGFADLRLRQVVRWANEKKLPFFRMGKRVYIGEEELVASIKRRQLDAVRRVSH